MTLNLQKVFSEAGDKVSTLCYERAVFYADLAKDHRTASEDVRKHRPAETWPETETALI